jgi:hypothetical protein
VFKVLISDHQLTFSRYMSIVPLCFFNLTRLYIIYIHGLIEGIPLIFFYFTLSNNEQKCMMNSELCRNALLSLALSFFYFVASVRLVDLLSAYVFILFTMVVNKDFLEVPQLLSLSLSLSLSSPVYLAPSFSIYLFIYRPTSFSHRFVFLMILNIFAISAGVSFM